MLKIAKTISNEWTLITILTKSIKHKMNNFLKNCEKLNIIELCHKKKKLNIILDNYSVHHPGYIEQVVKIVNINLIFLPTYSPDLNPIEDIWRIIKKHVSNKFIKSEKI